MSVKARQSALATALSRSLQPFRSMLYDQVREESRKCLFARSGTRSAEGTCMCTCVWQYKHSSACAWGMHSTSEQKVVRNHPEQRDKLAALTSLRPFTICHHFHTCTPLAYLMTAAGPTLLYDCKRCTLFAKATKTIHVNTVRQSVDTYLGQKDGLVRVRRW